jgi:hypothetical protein
MRFVSGSSGSEDSVERGRFVMIKGVALIKV